MHKNKEITILDCTLRDGGYYNNWNFTLTQITDYLKVIQEIGVDVIEIGFRFPNPTKRLGICARTEDSFLRKILPLKKKKFAIMINSSDYIIRNKANLHLVEKYFNKQDKIGIDIIRIASHFKDLEISNKIAEKLKNLGYEVCLNLMQISEIKLNKLSKKLKKINKFFFDVFYIADSLGSLQNDDILILSKFLSKHMKLPIGIHAHNNQDLALSNTLIASKNNFNWLDATFMGMGRGPGNVETEKLLLNISNKNMINKINLLTGFLYLKHFNVLKQRFQWGPNFLYYLAGIYSIHPSYIQALSNTSNSLKKIKLLNKLKELPNRNKFYSSHISKNKNSKIKEFKFEKIKNDKLMIIGNGISLKKNISKIKKIILKEKLCVLLLNHSDYISEELIDYRILYNPIQILESSNELNDYKKPVIVPKNSISLNILSGNENVFYFNYFLQKTQSFESEKKNMTLFFAKCFIEKLKLKKIYLVGIDGYKQKPYQNSLIRSIIEDIQKISTVNLDFSKILNSKIQ